MRELFHRLRDEDLRHVPSFRVVRPIRLQKIWRPLLAAAVLIVVILGVVAVGHRRPPVAESIVTWKAPTDFLLRTPGSEILSAVPRIPERR